MLKFPLFGKKITRQEQIVTKAFINQYFKLIDKPQQVFFSLFLVIYIYLLDCGRSLIFNYLNTIT